MEWTTENMLQKLDRMNNIGQLIYEVMKRPDINSEVIDLNQSQLREFGIDARGEKIRTLRAATGEVYALYTISVKKTLNQPTDHVTLYSEGEFYKSMQMIVQFDNYDITANFQKENGTINDNLRAGTEPLGLTDENLQKFATDTLIPYVFDLLEKIYAESF